MKKSIKLEDGELTVEMKLGSFERAYGDGNRTCDLKFTTDAFDFIGYMMESDARNLARWILKNTKEQK